MSNATPTRHFDIRVQATPFDPAAEQDALRRDSTRIGAMVAFVGQMRDFAEDGPVHAMTLEHYPGMTERALAAIARAAAARWVLDGIRIVHRVGRLLPGEPIVLVAVTSHHRGEAFRACEFLIDYLKTRAPFWKREETATGARWVTARDSDAEAAAQWEPARTDPD
ncbi:MAG: molybdenum cofactor biosynthesis protein MoaE [Chromatiaceae bacterium]|nr:MAG: molybdenum cofactor biosynthesis protein MoaE [Chromatiaceae bacterium]